MKRNWKRILSLWLTVCMVFTMNFGLGATAVYADETEAVTAGSVVTVALFSSSRFVKSLFPGH